MSAGTAAELLLDRADDDGPALLFEDRCWSYRQLVDEGRRRAAFRSRPAFEVRNPELPLHIGILLDNSPEYLFWLAAAALSGSVLVGINSTYRGEPLGQLITHTDCDVVVTSTAHLRLLEGLDDIVPHDRLVVVDGPDYRAEMERMEPASPQPVTDDDLFLLIFTSGSTGRPKAVRCTQGRFARTGAHVATVTQAAPGEDVVYCPLPFFHSASLFSGWAGALNAAVPIATRPRFSASGTLPDLRRHGATVLTYTGKVLNYILSVPESPDDAESRLRLALGNEASLSDIREFARRFCCTVRDSYGSTEGMIIIRRDPSMPEEALGAAAETVKVIDGETMKECPPVAVGADGRGVTNLEDAVGEIVETAPTAGFEGYYKNPVATSTRFRNGWYWSGDLGYRDAEGWFYFAGRSNEWLRVDGENFAAAPVEAIVARHASVRSVAVYAVPDDPVGDRVMVALELERGASFDSAAFDGFLASQQDLGPKWVPAFVRTTAELPKLASMKIDKTTLRREAWTAGDVWWRPAQGENLRPLTAADRRRLEPQLKARAG